MGPFVKPTASMLVAIAAAELTLWILSYIPVFHIGFRSWIPSLLCDAGLIYMLKYIAENHYSVKRWQSAVKLSGYISAFYTFLVAPPLIYGISGIIYVTFLSANTFIVVCVMLLALVYVKY